MQVLETIATSSTQYAESANRQIPTAHDVIDSLAYVGLSIHELAQYAAEKACHRKRVTVTVDHPVRKIPQWADPTAAFLPSDSDSDLERPTRRRRMGKAAADWNALMRDIVPDHLPPQPPRHCWMFTPVYATQMLSELPALQLVNRKLENARLVESSLRKLIRDTDTAALPQDEKDNRAFFDGFVEEVAPDGTRAAASAADAPNAAAPAVATAGAEQSAQTPARSASAEHTQGAPVAQGEPMETDTQPGEAGAGAQGADGADDAQSDQSDTQEEAPRPARAGERQVLPRIVNYKASWYSSTAAQSSGIPSTNLYTAKLRGGSSEGRKSRRYFVENIPTQQSTTDQPHRLVYFP
ncbi:hypothetical protein MCUN1_003930 [Malassezia cuniculi]|uniref:Transcription initiation factor TFIID subunit 8 n=1 Tax=Malassezia cuniculi TaxID=948313 RepID=A0AAF0ETX2_9BASI|nr:hypothetical protein MCUN1_003930 [Malassezia cuniculi]